MSELILKVHIPNLNHVYIYLKHNFGSIRWYLSLHFIEIHPLYHMNNMQNCCYRLYSEH